MSLLSSIFDTGAYTVTRASGIGTIDSGGHFAAAGSTTLSITGSVQPLSGRALRDLKEGKRADDVRWFFTESPMFTTDEGHDQQDFMDIPDEVNSAVVRRYRATKIEWFGVISGHYRVTLEKTTVP